MFRSSTRQTIIMLTALNAVALLASGYSYWELHKRNSEITAINKEVEAYAATDANLQALQVALDAAKDEVAHVDSFYVSPDGAVDFLEAVEELARKRNISPKVESVDSQIASKETKSLQERIKIRLETNGTWQDTYNFLLMADNLPYKVRLDGVHLERLDNRPAATSSALLPKWKGDFEISALKLK